MADGGEVRVVHQGGGGGMLDVGRSAIDLEGIGHAGRPRR